MDLLPGLLVLTASLDGFSTASAEVQIPLSSAQSVDPVALALSPILDPHTEMRLVMSWGRLPKDLDLHVLKINRFECHLFLECIISYLVSNTYLFHS